MPNSVRQFVLITLVATGVTLGVNLAFLRYLGWHGPSAPPPSVVAPAATVGAAPTMSGQIPVAMRTVSAQPPAAVVLPTSGPNAALPAASAAAVVSDPSTARQPIVADRNFGGVAPTAAPPSAPCLLYSLSEVLAAFRRADLPLRDSLFDPAYPGTDQPFPITARVQDYARGVSGLPGLRLDLFILPDEAQIRVLQGDAGRWALQQQRQVRVFPYRNVVLIFYEVDPARAVPYERALVRLP